MLERSFSHMKIVKTRLRNCISDCNLARSLRIAIEEPELSSIVFDEKNRHIDQ